MSTRSKGHNPYFDEPPFAIDVGTDKNSPDYGHPERCSQVPRYSNWATLQPSPVAGGHCMANPYLCTIFGIIMRQQHYPQSARVQHIAGTAVVAFWLDDRGDLTHEALYRTSGHAMLDAEAIAAVRRAAPFPPPPPDKPHGFVAQMSFPPK
ncbi:hypothetical protein MHY1_00759 [Methylovirgula sp. HY1]|nr:hypothetical protein MHY1_00759 [Methylovirgula sp. HY1]